MSFISLIFFSLLTWNKAVWIDISFRFFNKDRYNTYNQKRRKNVQEYSKKEQAKSHFYFEHLMSLGGCSYIISFMKINQYLLL